MLHHGEAVHEIEFDLADDFLTQLELAGDGRVALDHSPELAVGILALERGLRKGDEQIGDFSIAAVALAGRGNHHDPPRGIGQNDVDHLIELPRVRERTPSEFTYLHKLKISLRSPMSQNAQRDRIGAGNRTRLDFRQRRRERGRLGLVGENDHGDRFRVLRPAALGRRHN